jgi:transcriptional regulator with XRE-family HTH domain
MSDLEQLGVMLRRRRSERTLTLREAADESGVPFSTLSRIEKGHLPDLANFQRLIEWLGVSADEFFRPTESAETTPDVIAEHLRADPALPPEAASRIADIVRDLYASLAISDRRYVLHLRASKTFAPAALNLLTELLDQMQASLESRFEG